MAETTYFTPEYWKFFRDLSKNNNKEWFTANKEHYEAVVQAPSLRFVRDAGERLQKVSRYLVADPRPFGGSLTRIYRDIRFSHDKSPYKTHIGIHFWHGTTPGAGRIDHRPGVALHLESGASAAYSGVWRPDPPVLKKIRTQIVAEPVAWKKVLGARLDFEGDIAARPPPGFDPNHPLIRDLRRKDFVAHRAFRDSDVMSPRFLDTFVATAKAMDPLNRFLAGAIGLPW